MSFPDGSRQLATASSVVDALIAGGVHFECEEVFSRASLTDPTLLSPRTREERTLAAELAHILAGSDAQVIRKLLAAHDAMRVSAPHRTAQVSLNYAQAKQVIDFFSGDDGEVTIAISNDGHSGPGLYIWNDDHPEEGASFLKPDAPPQPRTD